MKKISSKITAYKKKRLDNSRKPVISYKAATISVRLTAYLIDTAIKSFFIAVFYAVVLIMAEGSEFLNDKKSNPSYFILLTIFTIFFIIIVFFYHIIFELIWKGQTPGKKMMNLSVVLNNGHKVTLKAVLIRNALRVIDWLPIFYLIGLIFMLIRKNKQRYGDWIAETYVCELPQKKQLK